MKVWDISVKLAPGLPTWPTSPGHRYLGLKSVEADGVKVSELQLELHTGTHIDAPSHFIRDGGDIDSVSLADLIGPAQVVGLAGVGPIDGAELSATVGIPLAPRLLLRTHAGGPWKESKFWPEFRALDVSGAEWIIQNGIRLVGIDYLSIQRFEDGPAVHQILLSAGVVVVEGLDLSAVDPGKYGLIVAPLRLHGVEAAPARALLVDDFTFTGEA